MAAEVTPLTRDQVALVESHLKLVAFIARSFRRRAREYRIDLDDVIQEGNLALVNAARTWDPLRSGRTVFATHAGCWVRRRILTMFERKPMPTKSEFATIADHRPHLSLEPLSPITSLIPSSACPHRGPIDKESVFVCIVCFAVGNENHPALRRDPETDPRPEAKPKSPPRIRKRETRREHRKRMFAGSPLVIKVVA